MRGDIIWWKDGDKIFIFNHLNRKVCFVVKDNIEGCLEDMKFITNAYQHNLVLISRKKVWATSDTSQAL